VLAAAWASAKEKISLQEWLDGSFVLVLGNSHYARPAIRAMNQVIFKRISELLLEQPDSSTRRTWICLDELRQAGRLDGLSALAVEGRSRGVCLVAGTQDHEGLQAVYGKEEADEILGMLSHKAFLQVESPASAKWASEVVGEYEVKEIQIGTTYGPGGTTESETEHKVKREAVLPSEFMSLPPTNRVNGLTGYFISRGIGCWKTTLAGDYLTDTLLPPDKKTPNRVSRPREELRLKPWTEAELKKFGISLSPEPELDPKVVELEPRRKLKAAGLKRNHDRDRAP
jgi:type IV secretory pathway TraG/TraD family ATPase VirD4